MSIETTDNSYEYKLAAAGIQEPLRTYLSDPRDADRMKAGFPSPIYAADGVTPVGLSVGSGGYKLTGSYWGNLSAANSLSLRKAIGKVKGGRGRAKLVVVSDSTGAGMGAGTGTANATGARPFCWPTKLAAELALRGIPAQSGHLFSSHNLSAAAVNPANYDARIGALANWAASASLGAANSTFLSTTDTAALAFTPTQAFDTVETYYAKNNASLGTADLKIDAGATLTSFATGAPGVAKVVTSGIALATHTINTVKTGTTSFHLLGHLAYNSLLSELDIINWSAQSGTTADFNISTGGYSASATPAALAADEAFIVLTTNDAEGNTIAQVAAYEARLTTLVNAFIAAGTGVTIGAGLPAGTAKGLDGTYAEYFAAARRVAIATGVKFFDIAGYLVDYNTQNNYGFMADTRHGNGSLYANVAAIVASGIAEIALTA